MYIIQRVLFDDNIDNVSLAINIPASDKGLLFVAVVVVNAYQRTAEGQYLTEGNEERVVNLTHGRGKKPRGEQCAPESAHGSSDYEL